MKEMDRKTEVEVKEERMGRVGQEDEGQRGWRGTGRRKGWRGAREGVYSQDSYSRCHAKVLFTPELGFHVRLLNLELHALGTIVLLTSFSWVLSCLLAPQPISHCRATPTLPAYSQPISSSLSREGSLLPSHSAFTASSQEYIHMSCECGTLNLRTLLI